jgi:hypothetical protein
VLVGMMKRFLRMIPWFRGVHEGSAGTCAVDISDMTVPSPLPFEKCGQPLRDVEWFCRGPRGMNSTVTFKFWPGEKRMKRPHDISVG